MKIKLFSAILLIMSASSLCADPSQQEALNSLQSQINALQSQIANMQNPANVIGLDTAIPFGTMSKVEMPLALIKARNTNTAPIVIGGQVEADVQYWNGTPLTTSSGQNYNTPDSSIAFTKLYLFTEANINENTIGLITLKNTLPANTVQFDRAFLMLGKLNPAAPLFVTVGMSYLPFGNFSGNGPLDNSLTTDMFRVSQTDQVSLNMGYGPFTFIGSMFNNNSTVNASIHYLFTGLFNKTIDGYSLALGTSYLTNIVGTSSGLGSAFHQMGSYSSSAPLQSNTNPAWDANFTFGKPIFSVLGEYVTTLRASTNQNQNVGKISAWLLGTTGKFSSYGTPYTWQLSYAKTTNMQNVPMPFDGNYAQNLKTATGFQNQWIGSIQGEYFQNVYIGPELTYGNLYNSAHTYTATLDATAYF